MNIHPIARLIRYCLGRNIACVKINSVKKQQFITVCYNLLCFDDTDAVCDSTMALTELFADGLWTASKSFS